MQRYSEAHESYARAAELAAQLDDNHPTACELRIAYAELPFGEQHVHPASDDESECNLPPVETDREQATPRVDMSSISSLLNMDPSAAYTKRQREILLASVRPLRGFLKTLILDRTNSDGIAGQF